MQSKKRNEHTRRLRQTAGPICFTGPAPELRRLLSLRLGLRLRGGWPRCLAGLQGNLAPFIFHAIQNVLGNSRGLHTILFSLNAKGDETLKQADRFTS